MLKRAEAVACLQNDSLQTQRVKLHSRAEQDVARAFASAGSQPCGHLHFRGAGPGAPENV